MLKPILSNILIYLFTKYLVFYTYLMFRNNDFRLLEIDNLKGGGSFTYFFYVMLPLPITCMILFSAPIYYSFKVRSWIYFLLIIAATFIAEYFFYVFFTSGQHPDVTGIYNGIISIVLLFLFFFKHIVLIFKQRSMTA